MPRPGVTYKQVAVVADGLKVNNEYPSIQRIRSILKTGSPNTIHKHLTRYNDESNNKCCDKKI